MNLNYENIPQPSKKNIAIILLEYAKEEDNNKAYIEAAIQLLKGN